MSKLYSIGETAKIMGISVQTLRNYSNLDLIQPEHIDSETNYRYYSFKQFHYIDRIIYLRSLGMPLKEIREIFKGGDIDKLTYYLVKQKEKIEQQIAELSQTKDNIEWYRNYFNYLNSHNLDHIPYIRYLEKRYVLNIPYLDNDTNETAETRLAILKNELSQTKIDFLRQYGFIADFQDLMNNKFTRQEYFIYLKDPTGLDPQYFRELPAGEYLCFRAKILTDDWDIENIKKYFETLIPKTDYVIANEHEDNLVEYHDCPYEIQILINEK